jgi:hypothetical protein
LRSWSLNKRADRGELELEYNDVGLFPSCLLPYGVNMCTGWRPERLQVYLLNAHMEGDRQSKDDPCEGCENSRRQTGISVQTPVPACRSIQILMTLCAIVPPTLRFHRSAYVFCMNVTKSWSREAAEVFVM